MKNIIFTTLTIFFLSATNTFAEKIDCAQFEKITTKYLECAAKNLKKKSTELKLKATIGAGEVRKR